MSLTRLLSGGGSNSENFIKIISAITPTNEDFFDIDGGPSFQNNEVIVDKTHKPAFLEPYVHATFTMLARIAICKYTDTPFHANEFTGDNPHLYFYDPMVELKLNRFNNALKLYLSKKASANSLIEYCFMFACIQHLRSTGQVQVNKDLISKPAPAALIEEVSCLFEAFENTFISSNIASKDSNIILAPQFSKYITGALRTEIDLDFVIDDAIYLFDFSSKNTYDIYTSRQLAAFYILHLCDKVIHSSNPYLRVHSDNVSRFRDSKINKLVIYKARLGCIDFTDARSIYTPSIKESVTKMLEYLKFNAKESCIEALDI